MKFYARSSTKTFVEVIIGVWVILAIVWLANAFKLSQCDFESNWKCEVIHAVGLVVPPASIVTVWFDTDGE